MKNLILAMIISITSNTAFSAEKLVRECKSESGGWDTHSASLLQIRLVDPENEYGGYQVVYQYERSGMGGEQKIDGKWDNLFCRLDQNSDFDCQQISGEKPVKIVAKSGSIFVLEIDRAQAKGIITSEGKSLVFDKPIGTCVNR